MALNLTDADVLDDDKLPELGSGESFTHLYVYDQNRDLTLLGKVADVQGILMPTVGSDTGKPPTITLELSAGSTTAGKSIVLTAKPVQGTAAIKQVEFFDGGTRVGAPGTAQPYQATYTPQTSGTHALVATVTDAAGNVVTSAVQYLQVAAVGSVQPTVTLNPVTPTSAVLGTSFTLVAQASVAGGSIAKVEFFDGAAKIGEDTSTPYAIAYTPGSTGQHVLSAKATDLNGNTAISTTQTITITAVAAGPNQLPTVSLTLSPATITLGQSTTLTSPASDTDGSIVKVEFFDGTTSLAVVTAAPYTFTYTPTGSTGNRQIKAVATDDKGGQSTAGQVLSITAAAVAAPAAPTFTGYDQTARTATVAPPTGYTIGDLRYTISGGAVTAVPANGQIPVGNGAVVVGAIQCYVVASGTRPEGLHAVNEVGYSAVVTNPVYAQVLSPGDNVDTLTFSQQSQGKVRYNNPVQTSATTPGAGTMAFFFPDLNTQVGQLNFDFADSGHPCSYELGGKQYFKDLTVATSTDPEQTLKFKDGSVLLG